MALGYRRARRYVGGWLDWQGFLKGDAEAGKPRPALAQGAPFPECRCTVLEAARDAQYLGLAPNAESFSLGQIRADFLLLEVYSEICLACQDSLPRLNRLARQTAAAGRLKVIGLAMGSRNREVAAFRKRKNLAFPLFADQGNRLFQSLGEPPLPALFLLKKQNNGWRLVRELDSRQLSASGLAGLMARPGR